jgi:arginyl-tRNA--protein-N-Asp/Glu arginylyltransferase
MAYKARFRPLERLTAEGWQPLPAEACRAIAEPIGER